jgi:tRNA(fMet)-specific endonuclease VapC
VPFDIRAAEQFQQLRKQYPRLDTMDLKIAAIALTNNAILLTRNQKDFGQIQGLNIEDWSNPMES